MPLFSCPGVPDRPPGRHNNTENTMVHIGREIQKQVLGKGMTVVAFARSIPTSRENVYRIFRKNNIDIKMLQRICTVLEHDFFKDISDSEAFGERLPDRLAVHND